MFFDIGINSHFGGKPLPKVAELLHVLGVHVESRHLEKLTKFVEHDDVCYGHFLAADVVALHKSVVDGFNRSNHVVN